MYYTLTAIILKRQNFKEDDLLITAYSLEAGKVVLQAKGAKRIKSKLAGHLEPLTLSRLDIIHAKHIDQLIGAQNIHTYYKIKNDLVLFAYAYYFLELIDGFTKEQQTDRQIFNLLKKSLDFFNLAAKNETAYKVARISFGFKLLYLLGFDLSFKEELTLKREINYLIQHPISLIMQNKYIIKKLFSLNKILDKQLELYLEKDIKTKEFLKQVI